MDTTLRELRWVAEHGFVAMNPPGVTQDPANPVPPLWDMYYEPFWAACEDLGLRLFVHAAYGIRLGSFLEGDLALAPGAERFKSDREDSLTQALREAEAENIRGIMVGPRRVFWELLLGRVFDRHPNLKLAFTEIRSTWVPGWLAYLDQRFEQENIPLKHRPSEYFRTQCMVTPSNPRTSEVAMRHSIGANQLMFGADFPHLESTWPNTLEWIQATFGYAAVPEDEARAILGENAIKFYGFDRAKLAAVAERIGAQASELLVPGRVVDPRKIASFDERSGFNKPMGDPLEGTQAMLDDALRQFAAGEMSRAN
jgi:predicted TIM-barrel fold metal-dependent hydrolase